MDAIIFSLPIKFSNSLHVRWKWDWSLVGSSLSRKFIRCFFFLQTSVVSLKTMHDACSPVQQRVSLFVCVKFRAHTTGMWGEPSAGCSKSVKLMAIVEKKKTCHLCYLSELAVVVSLWSANMTVFICPYKINSAMFISSPHPSEFIWTAASGPYHLYEWTNSHCK